MTETEFSLEMGASMGTSAVAKWWKMKKLSDLKNIPKLNWATWFKTHYHSQPADGRYFGCNKIFSSEKLSLTSYILTFKSGRPMLKLNLI